jgi:6,7-dimethyl-8-ribityllumazine synthase
MPRTVEGHLSAEGLDFSIIVSRFNDFITMRLLDGALDALLRHGARDERITVYRVPGSFEIPMLAKKVIDLGQAGDAMICLGALIRGATPHFDYIAAEASKGIASAALASGIPVTFGVLIPSNRRSSGLGAKLGTRAGKQPCLLSRWPMCIASYVVERYVVWVDGDRAGRRRYSSCTRST